MKFAQRRLMVVVGILCLSCQAFAGAFGVNRMYVFGDSLSDTGNLYSRIQSVTFGLYDFPASPDYTRYRFTNGSDSAPASTRYAGVWEEQLAGLIGVPRATPSESGGNNFAFAGSTSGTGRTWLRVVIPSDNLDKQTSDFIARPGRAPTDALYTVWSGGNDVMNAATAWFASPSSVIAAARTAAANVKREIVDLIREGATKILWPNLPPLQNTPQGRGLSSSMRSALATASTQFKTDWTAALASVRASYPSVNLIGLDVLSQSNLIAAGPASYGLSNVTGNAQGLNVNPDSYLFWDELHPTVRGHNILATSAYASLQSQIRTGGVLSVPEPTACFAMLAGLLVTLRRRRITV